MDIDTIDQYHEDTSHGKETTDRPDGKKPLTVLVDDAHPFELEAYVSSYSGKLQLQLFAEDTHSKASVDRTVCRYPSSPRHSALSNARYPSLPLSCATHSADP